MRHHPRPLLQQATCSLERACARPDHATAPRAPLRLGAGLRAHPPSRSDPDADSGEARPAGFRRRSVGSGCRDGRPPGPATAVGGGHLPVGNRRDPRPEADTRCQQLAQSVVADVGRPTSSARRRRHRSAAPVRAAAAWSSSLDPLGRPRGSGLERAVKRRGRRGRRRAGERRPGRRRCWRRSGARAGRPGRSRGGRGWR